MEIGGAARFDRKQDGEEVETQLCRVGLKEQSQGVAVPEQVTIPWRRRIGEEQVRRRKQVRFSRLDPLRQLHQGPRRCGAAERGATAAQAQAEAILRQWANNAVGERQVQQATTAELRLPKKLRALQMPKSSLAKSGRQQQTHFLSPLPPFKSQGNTRGEREGGAEQQSASRITAPDNREEIPLFLTTSFSQNATNKYS